MTKKLLLPAMLVSAALATGCASDGSLYRSDVYTAPMVNQAQEVKTVEIIAVVPARVAVTNSDNRTDARNVGMLLGAIAGAVIANQGSHSTSNKIAGGLAGGGRQELVNGVQITFRDGNRMFNSAQVGQVCEFKTGTAIMVSPSPNETRIQPNNPYGCPRK